MTIPMTIPDTIHDTRILQVGPDFDRASAVVILMHGRSGSPEDMRELAARIDLPSLRYILPEARGNSWYPNRFTAPIPDIEPWLTEALSLYDALVGEALRAGTPIERIVVAGFSQGACLTSEFLVRMPRHYGAALVFTGALMGPPGTTWPRPAELAGLPLYMSSSETDEWIPVWRYRESEKLFAGCGAAVRSHLFADRPHMISDEEVSEAREMLEKLFISPAL